MKDPNKLQTPRFSSTAFKEGWRECEAGCALNDNPYPHHADGAEHEKAREWRRGFEARAEIGFETAHLPRKPGSDAFAF